MSTRLRTCSRRRSRRADRAAAGRADLRHQRRDGAAPHPAARARGRGPGAARRRLPRPRLRPRLPAPLRDRSRSSGSRASGTGSRGRAATVHVAAREARVVNDLERLAGRAAGSSTRRRRTRCARCSPPRSASARSGRLEAGRAAGAARAAPPSCGSPRRSSRRRTWRRRAPRRCSPARRRRASPPRAPTPRGAGVKTSLTTSIWAGWMVHLPSRPSARRQPRALAQAVVVLDGGVGAVDRLDARGARGDDERGVDVVEVVAGIAVRRAADRRDRDADRGAVVAGAEDQRLHPRRGGGDRRARDQAGGVLDLRLDPDPPGLQRRSRARSARAACPSSRRRPGVRTLGSIIASSRSPACSTTRSGRGSSAACRSR